jgi:hypothetical protein
MIFGKVYLLFRIRIRIHNLKLPIRIRILQKVSDPYGSGSTTLTGTSQELFLDERELTAKKSVRLVPNPDEVRVEKTARTRRGQVSQLGSAGQSPDPDK